MKNTLAIIIVVISALFFSLSQAGVTFNNAFILHRNAGEDIHVITMDLDIDTTNTQIIIYKDTEGKEGFVNMYEVTNMDEVLAEIEWTKNNKTANSRPRQAMAVKKQITPENSAAIGCFTTKGHFYSRSEEIYDRAMSMIFNKDFKAAAALAALDGCGLTKQGVKVFVENRKIFSEKALIRPEGQPLSFWTNSDAVICN